MWLIFYDSLSMMKDFWSPRSYVSRLTARYRVEWSDHSDNDCSIIESRNSSPCLNEKKLNPCFFFVAGSEARTLKSVWTWTSTTRWTSSVLSEDVMRTRTCSTTSCTWYLRRTLTSATWLKEGVSSLATFQIRRKNTPSTSKRYHPHPGASSSDPITPTTSYVSDFSLSVL